MPNDNTHTLCVHEWRPVGASAFPPFRCQKCGVSPSDIATITSTSTSRTPAEPKAGDDVPKFLRVLRGEPKAVDWDAVLLDTLLYSQGHGINTPPHEDPSDILDEYEKSIPDGAYRESIRSIRRALSSAASQPKAGGWGLRTWLEGQISILDRMLGESTSHSEQMNIGFARKAYEDVLIRMKPVENDPLHNEGWDADFFIASEVMPHVSKVKGTIYIEDATHFIKEAVRRALSSAAPRIRVDGFDPLWEMQKHDAYAKAQEWFGNPQPPAPLSGITEEMVERVIHDFVDPIAASLDPTAYDDGAEYAALEIKDRLIALLRQQGTEEPDA